MGRFERECRQANGDVFGTSGIRRAVPHPFAPADNDGLTRRDVDLAALVLDSQYSGKHDGVLVEVGPLSRLDPA